MPTRPQSSAMPSRKATPTLKNHMENKKKKVSVEIDDDMQALLQERIEYLQSKRQGTKVTVSDAIRHALSYTGYKRGSRKGEEE